jgi:hypothetical protein
MSNSASREAAKTVVRRNTEEVQGKGKVDVFEEVFADDFVGHKPQPSMTADKGFNVLGPTIRQSNLLSTVPRFKPCLILRDGTQRCCASRYARQFRQSQL